MNLVELIDRYNSDDTCRAALERLRWPVGVACLRCGDMDVNDLGKHNRERIPDVTRKTLHAFIGRAIRDEAEAIYTDDLKSYLGICDDDTRHETVNHSAEEWAVGDVHTNSIEGVWSLFKRSIVGAFHKMSVKHMDRYLEELEWRFNNRNNPHIFRDTLARIMNTDPLQYRKLVA